MPVYLLTYHAYGSWMPDRPRGYVRTDQEGILPPDPVMAGHYRDDARHSTMIFDLRMQQLLVLASQQVCRENNWRLHQAAATPTHLHLLVSWSNFVEWDKVSRTLKRRLGAELSKALDRPGPWFGRGCSRKRVLDPSHFEHLTTNYLPKHRGVHWSE